MISGQIFNKLKFFPFNLEPESWELAVRELTGHGQGWGLGQPNKRCDGVSWPVERSVK